MDPLLANPAMSPVTSDRSGAENTEISNSYCASPQRRVHERLPLERSFVAPERQPARAEASPELPGLMLVFTAVREADVYVPRSLGTLRHGNEFLERTRSPGG